MRSLIVTFLFVGAVGSAFAEFSADKSDSAVLLSAPGPAAITRDQFVALLERNVSDHFRMEGDLQLELLRPWTPPSNVATRWTLDMQEYPQQATSSMLVRCRLLADGETAAELSMVCRATHWREVWVARQPLAVGTTFDPAVLDTRRVDVFRERDIVPASAGDRSLIVTRAIGEGRLLTWHDLSRRPLVRKGQLVEVSAVDGLLNISMKALALENGAQGDMVTVRNPESRKDFSAQVIDENHVQVHF